MSLRNYTRPHPYYAVFYHHDSFWFTARRAQVIVAEETHRPQVGQSYVVKWHPKENDVAEIKFAGSEDDVREYILRNDTSNSASTSTSSQSTSPTTTTSSTKRRAPRTGLLQQKKTKRARQPRQPRRSSLDPIPKKLTTKKPKAKAQFIGTGRSAYDLPPADPGYVSPVQSDSEPDIPETADASTQSERIIECIHQPCLKGLSEEFNLLEERCLSMEREIRLLRLQLSSKQTTCTTDCTPMTYTSTRNTTTDSTDDTTPDIARVPLFSEISTDTTSQQPPNSPTPATEHSTSQARQPFTDQRILNVIVQDLPATLSLAKLNSEAAAASDTCPTIDINYDSLERLHSEYTDRAAFIRRLFSMLFTVREVYQRNVTGMRGNVALDPAKMAYIQSTYFRFYPAEPYSLQNRLWKEVTKIIEQHLRNVITHKLCKFFDLSSLL